MAQGSILPSAGNSVYTNISQSGSVYSAVVQNLITYLMTYEEIVLISIGFDSLLAVKVIQDQSIHVEGYIHAIRNKCKGAVKRSNALWVAKQLGIKRHIVDIVEEYKNITINSKYGYVANINSCLDYEIFMVQKAPFKPLVTEKMPKVF